MSLDKNDLKLLKKITDLDQAIQNKELEKIRDILLYIVQNGQIHTLSILGQTIVDLIRAAFAKINKMQK